MQMLSNQQILGKSGGLSSDLVVSPFAKSCSVLFYAAGFFRTLAKKFWETNGPVQNYVDFLLCELDPRLSRQRIAAEVMEVFDETANVKTFCLQLPKRWGNFQAGQFITLELEIDGVRTKRSYSISSVSSLCEEKQQIHITVKHIENGRGSGFMHEHVQVGDIIYVSPAMGEFILADKESEQSFPSRMLFLAAGSGITPIYSMLQQLAENESDRDITLIYHVNNEDELIFGHQLALLALTMPNFTFLPRYTGRDGLLSLQQLQNDCPDIMERQIYLCGPSGFMQAAKNYATELNVPDTHIKQELFGLPSRAVPVDGDAEEAEIHFNRSGKTVQSDGSETLLELAEKAGLKPKYGCRAGICHECKCTKNSGEFRNVLTGKVFPADQTLIQACIAVPVTDATISDL